MWISTVTMSSTCCPMPWVISSSILLWGTTCYFPATTPFLWCIFSLFLSPGCLVLRLSKRLYCSHLRGLIEKADIILEVAKIQLLSKNHSLECKLESGSDFNASFRAHSIPSVCLCSTPFCSLHTQLPRSGPMPMTRPRQPLNGALPGTWLLAEGSRVGLTRPYCQTLMGFFTDLTKSFSNIYKVLQDSSTVLASQSFDEV